MEDDACLRSHCCFAGAALAQAYPNRPVKVVVPWPPGQATDIAARVVAEKLQQRSASRSWSTTAPGAGGAIGTDVVAKSAPDGYTLLAASSGPISIMPNLQKTPYEPLKDFAPVSLICHDAVRARHASVDSRRRTRSEFIALVKANPGKYTFASSGTGATAHLSPSCSTPWPGSRRGTCPTRAARRRSPT